MMMAVSPLTPAQILVNKISVFGIWQREVSINTISSRGPAFTAATVGANNKMFY